MILRSRRPVGAGIVLRLLQTAPYARALLREGDPRASNEEVATLVRVRMARQEVLKGTVTRQPG
ncbi:DUF5753 domain-containing protein [Streptomyces sp. ISID311]|uniref:DUF5753 domain-containing protein n=1 Tax=Streptomyces sp. ISID311 TaxID=2601673 RepID=UPI0021C2E9DE|nr:DUF5753 domain-containing protein [Streptomyces sp. ISID311]